MASSAPSTALVIAGTAAASAIATALAIRFFSDAGSKADKASLDAAVRKALEAASRSAGPVAMPKASSDKVFPATRRLLRTEQQRILVTGGAGFVGSHLVDALMQQGHIVYVLDNLFTGRRENIEHWVGEAGHWGGAGLVPSRASAAAGSGGVRSGSRRLPSVDDTPPLPILLGSAHTLPAFRRRESQATRTLSSSSRTSCTRSLSR